MLPILFSVIRILIFMIFITHDTPNYLVETGQIEKAKNVLSSIYQDQYVQEQMGIIEEEIKSKKKNVQSYGL